MRGVFLISTKSSRKAATSAAVSNGGTASSASALPRRGRFAGCPHVSFTAAALPEEAPRIIALHLDGGRMWAAARA